MNTRLFLGRRVLQDGYRRAVISSIAALVFAQLMAPAWAARPVAIPATPTTLVSDADRMISYRHGERMWQTSDGATHLLVNQGTLVPTGTSLRLYSSFDGGGTWNGHAWLEGTGQYSTADGILTGNDLEVVYNFVGGRIGYAHLNYDALARTWSTVTTETVFASTGVTAFNPALAIDGDGGRWCGFVSSNNATSASNIRLISRGVGAPAWTDTGLVFGEADDVVDPLQRSARPIAIAGGVGMVYKVREKMYWATRLNSQPPGATWTNRLLFAADPGPEQDPFGSHFSIAADGKKNLHLATVDKGVLIYLRYNSQTAAWSAARPITGNIIAGYPQVTVSESRLALLVNTAFFGGVWQSANGGATFSYTHLLTHPLPPPASGINYEHPRIESPGRSLNPMPVLQQYFDGTNQRLMFFSVPFGN